MPTKTQNPAEEQLQTAVKRLQQSVGAIRAAALIRALVTAINAEKTQERTNHANQQ